MPTKTTFRNTNNRADGGADTVVARLVEHLDRALLSSMSNRPQSASIRPFRPQSAPLRPTSRTVTNLRTICIHRPTPAKAPSTALMEEAKKLEALILARTAARAAASSDHRTLAIKMAERRASRPASAALTQPNRIGPDQSPKRPASAAPRAKIAAAREAAKKLLAAE